MQKTSTVRNVQANGTFDWNDKTFYKFEISFENGDCGCYNSVKPDQNKFVIGTKTDYEFIDGDYPKVKPIYMQQNQSNTYQSNGNVNGQRIVDNSDRGTLILRQSCLKSAVEAVGKHDPALIIKTAAYFAKWVQTGAVATQSQNGAAAPIRETATAASDDLPF